MAMTQYRLQIFYLKKRVIFPFCAMKVELGASPSSRKIQKGDKIITLPVRSLLDILFSGNKIATLVEVNNAEEQNKTVKLEVKGLSRVRIIHVSKFKEALFEVITEEEPRMPHELMDSLRKKSQELIFLINVDESDKLINLLNYLININQLIDFISNYFVLDFRGRYGLFNELDLARRGEALLAILTDLIKKLNEKRTTEQE
jgi:ATP-dependent Lon protease